jgi:spore maturation protein CgeB
VRIFVQHPGVNWSLSDVFDGIVYGLVANGAHLAKIDQCDWIIVVNGNLHDPGKLKAWSRTYAPVAVLCTESPYDMDQELARVAVADGAWTHERLAVAPLQSVNPNVSYLPHAWHPQRHGLGVADSSVPAHDVVFVGTCFGERAEWFNAIDWSGIDLGLYGLWEGFGLDEHVEKCIRHDILANRTKTPTVDLYRRAKMSLNLYRTKGGPKDGPKRPMPAISLNPRAYELAACGVFYLSTPRLEVANTFGELVPVIGGTRETAKADERVIRDWLARDADRAEIAQQLPASVAGQSWVERGAQVLEDLKAWTKVAA